MVLIIRTDCLKAELRGKSFKKESSGYKWTIEADKKRHFDIEEMFKDFRSGGYNLVNTNVSDKSLLFLILVMIFACSLATFKGQEIKKKGIQTYVGRVGK